MSERNFFAELKRRNVYKVAVAYAVVGWLLVQIATQTFPFFDIPNWAVRLVVLAIIIGFPIALVIAWAFELTPEGIARTGELATAPARRRGRAWMYVVLIGAALSVGLFFLGRYTAPTRSAGHEARAKSIAVLPFVDLSQAKDQEYFCDGISEEILDALAKVEGLRVVARTSSFSFKGKNADVSEIAQKLNVDNVLEGSLRREGNRIRISVQLINARDGFHVWSHTFERELQGVFAVQDEITRAIVDALKIKLAVSPSVHKEPNAEAYELYLKGRYFYGKSTEEGLRKAIEYYQRAINKDPNYALAYVGMGNSFRGLGGALGFASPGSAAPQAKAAIMKALAIDDTLPDAHAALADFKLGYDWDWPGAEREYKRAIELNPNQASAHSGYGTYLQSLGRFDEAVAERERSRQLDPTSPAAIANVGYPLYYARHFDQALEHYRKSLELDPAYSWGYLFIGQVHVQQRRYGDAIDEIKKSIALSDGNVRGIATLGHAYAVAGQKSEALQIIAELQERAKQKYVSPYFIALVCVGLGDKDQAFAHLDKAYQERHPFLILIKVEPVFDVLHSDPRFTDLLRRIGFAP